MLLFQIVCVVVVCLALAAMCLYRPWRQLLLEYGLLVVCAWACENTAIRWYEHYEYASDWSLFIDRVPLLIVLIWPVVILSARDVAKSLGFAGRWLPLVATLLVLLDASLVEVIATNAGLWTWSEPGHLQVPLAGIFGWSFFSLSVMCALQLPRRLWLSVPPLTFVGTHMLIVGTWWGGFRYLGRGELGNGGFVIFSVVSLAVLVCVILGRRKGGGIGWSVSAPRLIATSVFLWLLLSRPMDTALLWWHTAIVAVPYLAAMRWKQWRPGTSWAAS